jgi:hypothetical protein
MSADDAVQNPVFANLRAEVVTKSDGRYLIYYSSKDRTHEAQAATSTERKATPAQGPWTPETGPAEGDDRDPNV